MERTPAAHLPRFAPEVPASTTSRRRRSKRSDAHADSPKIQKSMSQPRTGGRAPRSAEQKVRIAKSAANRRAKDRNSLAEIKGRLPPLEYGEEYNTGTALAGALQRFDRDEQTIRALQQRRSTLKSQVDQAEGMLSVQRAQWAKERDTLVGQRDYLMVETEATRDKIANMTARSLEMETELQRQRGNLRHIRTGLQQGETAPSQYPGMPGSLWGSHMTQSHR
ncbi:hypothetical protein DENSPDRAFT_537185 [Dentipellis sp. KUC8613]|nr:hypothetical protein DENSPDRAFT_537185 [Dentipellis sp. KUC8613]